MRTTLKRGLGRAETNGHLASPLSPLTAMARYGGRRRHPFLRLVGKAFLWLFVFLLVAAGALAGGAWLFINESVSAIRPHTKEVKEAQVILDAPVAGQPTTALIVGYDHRRFGVDRNQSSRSDTLMLVRADPKKKTVSLLSFPRDLVVTIPSCNGHPSFQDRINAAFSECGPKGSLKTVKELTGLPINYVITVNFKGFIDIVNRLGGVYLDIDQRYFNNNEGVGAGSTYATINLHPGYQLLNGQQALSFVRYRHTDSDLYRVVRQQEFVKAIKQQISSFWAITKVPGIVNVITHNVEVAKGGSKQIDPAEVYSYAKLAYDLPAGNFQQVAIDGLTGYYELNAPPDAIQQAVQRFTNPDTSAAARAANVATGRKAKPAGGPDPSTVTIEVQNGNGKAGSAGDAGYLLSKDGYKVANGGNADNFGYFHTKVEYDASKADAQAAAQAVANLFGDGEVAAAPAGSGQTTMLRVIVGQTFHGSLGPGPNREAIPKRQPPAVTRDLSLFPKLRGLRKRLGFLMLAPRVRERSSALDSQEPTRIYKVDGHNSLRLTYRTGQNEYWGIEETSWTDAPILNGPTLTRRIRGRSYLLFFNRSHLHMVGFKENGAAYWVVNTLLDRMSNETMLAIAQGMKPAGAP
ncbi:MAG: LytR family transcriptional regulator [Actinobacteria bacterium]|nr:MAG: LytR family transcriptional regulator [Actinomycetota bacterium]